MIASRSVLARSQRHGLRLSNRIERGRCLREHTIEGTKHRHRGVGPTPVKAIERNVRARDPHEVEGELGVDPKASAGAAATRPEEVGMIVGVDVPNTSVGRDDS